MLIHTDKETHVCNSCGKQYTRIETLTRHMKIHTEEGLTACTVCNKQYRCWSF